jgi:allophanate hydrolase
VNLMDLAAIAVPVGFRSDGLPFGVSLVAPAFRDAALGRLGAALHRRFDLPLGATSDRLPPGSPEAEIAANEEWVEIAVAGGHLSGMPLNRELLDHGARLVCQARTAAAYRMFRLDGDPPRPGLVRSRDGGQSIEIEIWSLSVGGFGAFVAAVPPPLVIGTLILDTGRHVKGFLCEAEAANSAEDITRFGGWRAYLAGLRG